MPMSEQSLPLSQPYWPNVDLSPAAFVAPNAVVMGFVEIGAGASIWYGAVIRGDVERIVIGEKTNIHRWCYFTRRPGESHSLRRSCNRRSSGGDSWSPY